VRITIASSFTTRPVRTLVAEIPGRLAAAERIVIAAHVQEPGANDNASGVATLAELARALRLGIAGGRIPRPERTLTFLWLEEISGSRQWLKAHPEEAKNVRYMFSMDMTGENVRKTGGSFLIERWPDPGAVFDRPWDPHTEWGRGDVRAEQLKGDLINDLHLAICLRVARKTGWIVKTNPYEGGSDHTVFGTAGVPAVLDWHFTDRYYHTNLDTPDKTSAREMRNVGVAVAASAWLLASARESTALAVAALVSAAGETRLRVEKEDGAALATADADPRMAGIRQVEIVATWRKWYAEAVRSASRLVVGPVSAGFGPGLEGLAAPFDRAK
jgi:Zn-dependent M28 family amino/carboxypeptidase